MCGKRGKKVSKSSCKSRKFPKVPETFEGVSSSRGHRPPDSDGREGADREASPTDRGAAEQGARLRGEDRNLGDEASQVTRPELFFGVHSFWPVKLIDCPNNRPNP